MDNTGKAKTDKQSYHHRVLLFSVLIVATCGLIYELVAGTLASYLLGDSVTQFSTIIGAYLFSMGIGSWLSKFIDKDLLRWFIRIEILVGIVGGCSAPMLFLLFEHIISFRIVLYSFVGLTGILVGLEIPLLMRILKSDLVFKDLVSQVFTFDYIGALLASIIFPLVLVPYMGLIRTSVFFGLFNIAVAIYLLYYFAHAVRSRRPLMIVSLLSAAILLGFFVYAERIMSYTEAQSYQSHVIYNKSTPYQRIAITRNNDEIRLFLNGNLQFNSKDEYRYHEALVHPAMQSIGKPKNILILGGGDGLAAREVLRYHTVENITLVDLDPAVTGIFSTNPLLNKLNAGALSSHKVKIVNTDAFNWVRETKESFDVVIVDFPDPSNYSIGKLYSSRFYSELEKLLTDSSIAVIQSTSPLVAPKSYWCINHTINDAGLITIPYHVYVPSFGEWGFVMAMKNDKWRVTGNVPDGLKFINSTTMAQMLHFPPDMDEVPTDINRLNNQVLVNYFEDEWAKYTH